VYFIYVSKIDTKQTTRQYITCKQTSRKQD